MDAKADEEARMLLQAIKKKKKNPLLQREEESSGGEKKVLIGREEAHSSMKGGKSPLFFAGKGDLLVGGKVGRAKGRGELPLPIPKREKRVDGALEKELERGGKKRKRKGIFSLYEGDRWERMIGKEKGWSGTTRRKEEGGEKGAISFNPRRKEKKVLSWWREKKKAQVLIPFSPREKKKSFEFLSFGLRQKTRGCVILFSLSLAKKGGETSSLRRKKVGFLFIHTFEERRRVPLSTRLKEREKHLLVERRGEGKKKLVFLLINTWGEKRKGREKKNVGTFFLFKF